MITLDPRIATGGSWGYFGGAFDPPHIGHLVLAGELCESANLTGIIFAPTFAPPHRNAPMAPFDERIKMTELACAGDSRFLVSDCENQVPPPSFTIDIIEQLCKSAPDTMFSIIIGVDNLAILHQWRRVNGLLELADIVVGARPGADSRVPELCSSFDQAKIRIYPTSLIDISSTALRARAKSGQTILHYTPPAVADYIWDRGLYQ